MTHKTPEQVASEIVQKAFDSNDEPFEGWTSVIAKALHEAYANGRRDGMEEAAKMCLSMYDKLKEYGKQIEDLHDMSFLIRAAKLESKK